MNKQEEANNCITPEMPYCPACKYGYIEHFEEDDTRTEWHCLRKGDEDDEWQDICPNCRV